VRSKRGSIVVGVLQYCGLDAAIDPEGFLLRLDDINIGQFGGLLVSGAAGCLMSMSALDDMSGDMGVALNSGDYELQCTSVDVAMDPEGFLLRLNDINIGQFDGLLVSGAASSLSEESDLPVDIHDEAVAELGMHQMMTAGILL